jgi:hypothetical protein
MITYHHDRRRARKQHTCVTCKRTIDAGETYLRGSGFGDGEAFTWKECAHCSAFLNLAAIAWEEEYSEVDFDAFEPSTVTEMRWKVQWYRKWRRRDGDLYPVPSLDAA